jgi:hypothetical protein
MGFPEGGLDWSGSADGPSKRVRSHDPSFDASWVAGFRVLDYNKVITGSFRPSPKQQKENRTYAEQHQEEKGTKIFQKNSADRRRDNGTVSEIH